MRFAAVETQEEMEDWVLSIRCAKVKTSKFIVHSLTLVLEQHSIPEPSQSSDKSTRSYISRRS